MTCVALEKTASISTDTIGSVGKSGSITRLTKKCFCLAKGKSAIEMATAADLVPTLELIKRAVEAGELDTQIDAAALKLRDGFGK